MSEQREFPRFDLQQRIQHGMMMVSFILCSLTGWALKTASTDPSSALAAMFGGIAGCGLIHRASAVVMLSSAGYHLLYVVVEIIRGRVDFQMVPKPSDLKLFWHNVLYMIGLRKEVPEFGRYTYFEKFDYWAVYWSMVVIGGSGIILWFPVQAAIIVPGWFIQIAHIAHGYEALLAALVIFIWHMYNVHLRPGVFPMSSVWLDGKMDEEEMHRYHAAELRRILQKEHQDKGA
jgi:cytochrome b subunit of formate dehydrogenase